MKVMNSKRIFFLILLLASCLFFAEKGNAIMINPDPTVFADDNGSTLFYPSEQSLALESFDFLGELGSFSEFGFYFAADPFELNTIFGIDDQDPTPNDDATGTQTAIVDFTNGWVLDGDTGNFEIESMFEPGFGAIGFYLILDPAFADITLFTDPNLNGGIDRAYTFQFLDQSDAYLLAFEYDDIIVSAELVNGVSPVPEPATLFLLGFGLTGLVLFKKRTLTGTIRQQVISFCFLISL